MFTPGKCYEETREQIVIENQGQKIFGILHRPVMAEPCPAVLICHGFGGHKVGRYRLYVTLAKKLSEQGIASLRIDFRGSGDSEGEFSEMTLEGEVDDTLKALKCLSEHQMIDSKRIGLFGRSLGGAVAVIAASQFPYLKSIGLWAPIYDSSQWQLQWEQLHLSVDQKKQQEMMTVEGQIPGYNFFQQFFSFNMQKNLNQLASMPMLLIHGHQDQVVFFNHAELYLQNRLNASGQTRLIQLPNSDHHFSDLEERTQALEETCQWFHETL
jgi:uncharacterized protein